MDGWFLEQFTTSLPTTTNRQTVNRQGSLDRSPRIVIHAAYDDEALAIWEQAVAVTVMEGLKHHRTGTLRRGASPRYQVAFPA